MKLNSFDYSEPAELYTTNRRQRGRQSMAYRRFETAAKAIRYSIEELPEGSLRLTTLEVNEDRYFHTEIRRLYESRAYPLQRPIEEAPDATKTQLPV